MKTISFFDRDGSFRIRRPEDTSFLYFPLASEAGLKSAVTPNLGGDAKLDQEHFLLEPVSSENLHNNRSTRNFWCVSDDGTAFSAVGSSAEQEAGKFTQSQDESACAVIELPFAGKKLRVSYRNEARKDYGEYRITSASLDGKPLSVEAGDHLILPRAELLRLSEGLHEIDITLN